MAKMFQWRKPEGNPSTNGFDVSRRDTYSTVPGILNPVRPRIVGPKSKFKISLSDTIFNSLPTVNQPFNRGSFYVDFYQVPMTQIMHRFDDFYTQLAEKFSTDGLNPLDDEISLPNLLHIDLWSLASLMMLDLKLFFNTVGSYDANTHKYLWFQYAPLAYDVDDFEPNSVFGVDVHGYPVVFGLLRLLDQMEYGNWYLTLKEFFLNNALHSRSFTDELALFIDVIFDDYISGEDTTDAYEDKVRTFTTRIKQDEIETLTHALDYVFDGLVIENNTGFEGTGSPQLYANMINLFAYQKVFSDIYRNSFYDTISPYAFNMDWYVTEGLEYNNFEFFNILRLANGSGSRSSSPLAYQVFHIRYRQFKNDMFTSLLPNSQFGDVSMVNVGDSVFSLKMPNGSLSTSAPIGVNQTSRVVGYGTQQSGYTNNVDFVASGLSFSVLMQRRAEALQKYKERYLRAGNRLKDQYVSEFGKVPYYLEDKYVRYLGSMSSALKVQGVPATSDSGAYDVGERAAYAYAGMDGSLDLSVDDWSVIVPIMYYLPETDYESFGLGAQNKFSEFSDFYIPEFENLGLEPVYRTTLSMLATSLMNGQYEVGGERVIGYGPSYMYFKTDVDKVHGEFGSTGYFNGVYSSWVTTRGNVSMSELSDYYVRPDFCNSIFKTQFNGSQHTDQFLCCLGFDWKAIEPLSVVGLPIWE